ncbi:hypothetical protein [Hyperthermus butylicus]|uniref:hypothetical protein n=1 Tax=Hyperthermus butylicus TaxID=54248 RepID=UPI00064FF265|nr:hypothetical protein [Hyperthermus butylicus]
MRGLMDWLTILLLLVFMLAMMWSVSISVPGHMPGPGWIGTEPMPVDNITVVPVAGEHLGLCRAGAMTLSAGVTVASNDTILIHYSVGLPNPCYSLNKLSAWPRWVNDTLVVAVEANYMSPPPHAVCIQVLPPPTTSIIAVQLPDELLHAQEVPVVVELRALDSNTGILHVCSVKGVVKISS